jgi:hypothetical protein
VGKLVVGLVVMFAVALLLSAAVPTEFNIVIEILLHLLLAAAVGFAVRVTSPDQGRGPLFSAGFLAPVGMPILFVTGTDPRTFGTSTLAGFNSPFLQVASALAAIVAVICAG